MRTSSEIQMHAELIFRVKKRLLGEG